MTDEDEDPGEDDGGVDVDDLATVARAMALTALRARAAELRAAESPLDLPLEAAMRGPGWAGRAFRAGFDPWTAAGARILWGRVAEIGIDMVRFDYAAPLGPMIAIDTAAFVLIAPPAPATPEAVLALDAPQVFAPPDASGWRSTAPERPAQTLADWRERIDALERGERRAWLVFKLRPRASRAWAPSARWF